MALFLLLLWCFLPSAVWAAYCAIAFRFSPARALWGVLLALGAVAAAVALRFPLDLLGSGLTGVPASLYSAFIGAALAEESAKLAAARILARSAPGRAGSGAYGAPGQNSGRGQEAGPDRMLLAGAILVGMSFSAIETVHYALGNPSVIWIRTLTALPVHAAASVLGAAPFLGSARDPAGGPSYGFFALACLLHGAYSACMNAGGTLIFGGLLALAALLFAAAGIWNGADGSPDRKAP